MCFQELGQLIDMKQSVEATDMNKIYYRKII